MRELNALALDSPPPSKAVTAAMGPPSKAVVDSWGPPPKPAPTSIQARSPDAKKVMAVLQKAKAEGPPNPWGDMAQGKSGTHAARNAETRDEEVPLPAIPYIQRRTPRTQQQRSPTPTGRFAPKPKATHYAPQPAPAKDPPWRSDASQPQHGHVAMDDTDDTDDSWWASNGWWDDSNRRNWRQ